MWQEEEGGEGRGPPDGGSSGKAGNIIRIRMENFMCHSNLSIDLTDYVNFITGQNGSGKSAILTALCLAFGIKARGTQRATSLKELIKNGCSHALIVVDMKNEGVDAFKPEVYGNKVTIERRMTETANSFVLKDSQGKKVASKKEDLQEIVDHFNIDVENPCVIMTQDKSREFLHGGSGKEKFKFFYRATLLQQVADLLNNISNNVGLAKAIIEEMEQELNPLRLETSQLEEKLRIVGHFEGLKQQLEDFKKMLPWSEVYEADQKLKFELSKLKKCQERKPACESRIQKSMEALEKVQEDHAAQKATIDLLLQKTEELRRRRAELENKLSQVIKDKVQIEEDQSSRQRQIKQKLERISWLEHQISDIRDRHVRASQAEELEREQSFLKLQAAIDDDKRKLSGLQAIESELEVKSGTCYDEARSIREELIEKQQEYKDLQSHIRRLENQRSNKVTAFGGDNVLRLLQTIEKNCGRFTKPPLGPIGAHVALTGDDGWALALESALGRMLNAFIVTNHRDLLLLRDCAKSCGYNNLQIIIYDFDRPLLKIPAHMLPDKGLLTVMTVIHTEIPTIMNVLIDQGSVERQVLVKDYDSGKRVIFERRNPNVKEAYTSDGTRMFVRGSTQTTLPPDGRVRSGRLCVVVDDQISQIQEEVSKVRQEITLIESKKHSTETSLQNNREELQIIKRRKIDLQRHITAAELRLREQKNSAQAEAMTEQDPNVDELQQEILKEQSEVQSKEDSLEKIKIRLVKAHENINEAKNNLNELIESCKGDIQALQDAENSLLSTEEIMAQAAGAVEHFKNIMEKKVLPEINQQENEVSLITNLREEKFRIASTVCPEEDIAGIEFTNLNSGMIKSKITRYHDKVRREEGRHDESSDQLRSKIQKRKRRLESKEKKLQFYKEKLEMVGQALQLRQTKFQRNAAFLKRQLQWQFNGHLRKKGMSGKVQVDFSSETLVIQVQMPQDSSNNMVKDTRGLSGGERSFSTLCFALALHEMTEAPFRAMDEFDVFMDAVSRKISLDTVVDFAVTHGSQWIFITPHDISMVKAGPRVKKQQMAAPRP